ncbi:hypothetical protein PIB30_064283 [Stylosanthes scabra]|uniref:Chloroplast envelope membrane protein n=1 Tax=Stylosanthes scabra TaxID=79078 RepID=A0ABU6UL93_9FABA|nr:hypothetical protein [Stylosanthes scabra]
MDSILHPHPLHSLSLPSPFPFPIRNQKLTPNSNLLRNNKNHAISITRASTQLPKHQNQNQNQNDVVLASPLKCLFKQALFCFTLGVTALGAFSAPPPATAVAIPAVVKDVFSWRKRNAGKEKAQGGHEYADCTAKLLETVSVLLRTVEGVRNGNGGMEEVEAAMKAVNEKKEKVRGEINDRLYPQLRVLRRKKGALVRRAGQIIDEILAAKGEYEKLRKKGKKNVLEEKEKAAMETIEKKVGELEDEYNGIWDTVGDFEDAILRKETVALSYGVREINFIQWECEQMVERFKREMRQKEKTKSLPASPVTSLTKLDIQKDLETAQRKHLEQIILPSILDVEDLGPFFHQDSIDFAQRLKSRLQESREMQRNLEAQIRKRMKKFGKENRYIVSTPEEEVVKGFPDVQLKWMFGNKEVVVPKAVSLHLYHGWKKWREEAKADLKRNLMEDAEFCRKYVAERQERILLDRDRVVSRTWYHEEKNRWEMDPVAVPYAVSRKLIEHARIRHDWGVMYVALKGEEKEFYVDIKEYEILFEDLGGFDGLYMKMLASGIPTAVHLMWIPFSELDIRQQFLLIFRVSRWVFSGLWNSEVVVKARKRTIRELKDITDDLMMVIGFPIIEFFSPLSGEDEIRYGLARGNISDS